MVFLNLKNSHVDLSNMVKASSESLSKLEYEIKTLEKIQSLMKRFNISDGQIRLFLACEIDKHKNQLQ